jgi:hypothetical protein
MIVFLSGGPGFIDVRQQQKCPARRATLAGTFVSAIGRGRFGIGGVKQIFEHALIPPARAAAATPSLRFLAPRG